MKGYAIPPEPGVNRTNLAAHEEILTDAVGNVIEFWGFKQNHGRVWALLYLRGRAMSATQIRDELRLSKGAVSMISRELEQWGVIRRVRPRGESQWAFVAETDLMAMIGRVVKEREAVLVHRVKEDLEIARRDAVRAKVDDEALARIDKLVTLARLIESALTLFLSTARLDVKQAFDVLDEENPT